MMQQYAPNSVFKGHSIPFVEFDIVFVVEPFCFGVSVDSQLLGLLSQGVTIVSGVAGHLKI